MKIYTLAHPDTLEIRYVGVTTKSLSTRLSGHIYAAKHSQGRHVINWIKTLLKQGKKPVIELIEDVDDDIWEISEQYWIAQFRAWGFRLTNTDKGGCGVITKDKRSKSSIQRTIEAKFRPVYQLTPYGDIIKMFKSIKEASESTGIKYKNITSSLLCTNLTNDYYFCYIEKYNEFKPNKISTLRFENRQKRYSLVS